VVPGAAKSKNLGLLANLLLSVLNRFVIFGLIAIYCAVFPVLYYVGPELKWFTTAEITYAAAMYYLVFNTLFVIGICYCLVGCVAYPYSTKLFSKNHMRQTNKRFGSEFIKCTERVSRVVQDMIETQGTANTSAILMAPMEVSEESGTNGDAMSRSTMASNATVQLNNKEIYTRVASNIELIGLYT